MTNSEMLYPLPDYEDGLATRELESLGRIDNPSSLSDLGNELWIHSGGNDSHIAVTLSWAMQLIEREALTPAQALDAAMILYFG